MNVILFGAGASYGAGDILPERPPLGTQLFHELARCFPLSWGALPAAVAQLFTDNFERGMARLWQDFSPVVPTLMQHMAVYFVQFRPRSPGATLYCRLVRAIERAGARERVLLSTLNYECLLEHSIAHAGVLVNYGTFPDGHAITLWKLHGACNLLPQGLAATRSVAFTASVDFGTSIRAANDLNEVLEFCLGDNALPPVMCLFMPGKPVKVSAGSIGAIQAAWRQHVLNAERVAVVGVFPNVEDTHVWDILAEAPGELLYVGGADAFTSWAAKHRSGRPAKLLAERFGAAFDSMVELVVG